MTSKLNDVLWCALWIAIGCIIGGALVGSQPTPVPPDINVQYVDYANTLTDGQLNTTIGVLDVFIAHEQANLDDVKKTRNTFAYALVNRT